MSKIKLSDFIAKYLKEKYYVKNVFMVSGGGAMHLNDSFGKYIPYIANHHEQACAIAAEGYARVNQELAVVNVTTGPGGLNCLNGVFGQWTDSAPVLYISGQVKYSTTMACCPDVPLRQLGDQEVDIISVVKHLTKYAKMVTNPAEIKYHIDKAIYEATSGRKGPVWLDIPMNVQSALIEEEELLEFEKPEALTFDMSNIDKAAEKFNSAKKPLIIAGHGIRLSDMIEPFKKLLEKTDIPVVTTFNGFDLIEDSHKNYAGRIGTVGQRAANFVLQNADCVLCLGTRNNIRQCSYNYENFAKNAYKIVVDIDSAELKKPTICADLKIHCDLKDFLNNFSQKLQNADCKNWLNFCKKLNEKFSCENCTEYKENGTEIDPYHFVRVLTSEMKQGDVLTMANGSACVCTYQTAVVKPKSRMILNSGDASMGYGLPAAIGACVANNRKSTVCIEGDGSIMMNIQELQTIKHNKLPVKVFILNNNGYMSIKQTQRNFFDGRMTGAGEDSGVSVPDFNAVAQAFGLKSIKICDNTKMQEQIRSVLDSSEPVVCDVIVKPDYIFTPKLSSRKLEDGTMISASLEDMYPFLNREEYNSCFI